MQTDTPKPETIAEPVRYILEKSRSANLAERPVEGSPLVSLILPVGNSPAPNLEAVLNSVRNQTWSRWELRVIDASGGKEHQPLLDRLVDQDPRIVMQPGPLSGSTDDAFRSALRDSAGEFVGVLEAEDVLTDNALAEIVNFFGCNANVSMVYPDHALMTSDGTITDVALKPSWSPELFLSTNYVEHFKVFRRSAVPARPSTRDAGMTCKVMAAGGAIGHLPKVLYHKIMPEKPAPTARQPRPVTEVATLAAYNEILTEMGNRASAAWPDSFRLRRQGCFKLEFPKPLPQKVAVVIPAISSVPDYTALREGLARTSGQPAPAVHVIGFEELKPAPKKGLWQNHVAKTQRQFDAVIQSLACDIVVFLSPSARIMTADWVNELAGYCVFSDDIGAAGGKVLNQHLCVRTGGLLLLDSVHPHCSWNGDTADGPWHTNLIASNVEAVSSRLLATRRAVYELAGGVPFFRYGDAAGLAYCLKLRELGKRVVYNPWSKVLDSREDLVPVTTDEMLAAEFGDSLRNDRYYHPYFSRTTPFTIDVQDKASPAVHT